MSVSQHCDASIGVHTSDTYPDTNLIYVLIKDRAVFDLIALPEGGNEKVRHKAIEGPHHVVFQYWLESPWITTEKPAEARI